MLRPFLAIPAAAAMLAVSMLAGCFTVQPEIDPEFRATLSEALLWNHLFPKLVVQIDYVEGREPTPSVLDEMTTALRDITRKESIVIGQPRVIPNFPANPKRVWNNVDLFDIDERTTQAPIPARLLVYGKDGVAYLHVLYLDGGYGLPNGQMAHGVQIGSIVVVFKDRMGLTDAPLPDPGESPAERFILLQEVGHAFGLVNCGVPMLKPRESSEVKCHSSNKDSVMFPYAADELHNAMQGLAPAGGWIPTYYDEDDLADLAAFRESGL